MRPARSTQWPVIGPAATTRTETDATIGIVTTAAILAYIAPAHPASGNRNCKRFPARSPRRGARMLRDLRHAIRVLGKARGWTLVVLVSLALGIGANTALFSAVDGMLFRTLPVADPDGLVRLRWTGDNGAVRGVTSSGSTGGMGVSGSFSYPVFEALHDANETLSGMFAATRTSLNLVVDGRGEIATGLAATGDYFRVLGVHPAAGRAIVPDDDRPGAEPVAMISHSFRERRFGPEARPRRHGHPRQRRPHHHRGRASTRLRRHSPAGRRGGRRASAPRHSAVAGNRRPSRGRDVLVAPDHGTADAGGDAGPGAGQPGRGASGRRAIGVGVVPGQPDGGGAGARAKPEPEHGAAAARRFRPAGCVRREPPVVESSTRPRRRRHARAAHRVRQRGHPAAVAGGVTPAGKWRSACRLALRAGG